MLLHLEGLFASLDDGEARGKRTGSVSPAVAREFWLNYSQIAERQGSVVPSRGKVAETAKDDQLMKRLVGWKL